LKETSSISNKLLFRGDLLTRITKYFVHDDIITDENNEEEEEEQRKYQIAKKGWQKVRKHYLAFMFLKFFLKNSK